MTEQQKAGNDVQERAQRFIDLANTMKNEGHSLETVNGSLMFAPCIYASYSAAGNEGYLQDSGIEKVVAVYQRNLRTLQQMKKAGQA